MKPLSHKQQHFIEEYLIDQNATQAYLRAGYKVNKKIASINGARLLVNARIAAEINRRLETKFHKIQISSDTVLQELAKLSFSNIKHFLKINEDGTLELNLKDVPDDQFAAIVELRFDEVYEKNGETVDRIRKVKIKLADKGANLERLGRYFKLFSDNYNRVTEESMRILRAVRAGEMTVEDASYDFAILGLPLPEVMHQKLAKIDITPEDNSNPPTTEEIMLKRAEQMMANIGLQKSQFIPKRRQEVAELKDQLRNGNAFSPGDFAGED